MQVRPLVYWLSLAAPILFLIISIALGFLTQDYTMRRDAVSSLVHGNYGMWQVANFAVCGILTLLALYLAKDLYPGGIRDAHLLKLGILTFGLSLVLLAVFPTDGPGQTTFIGQIHGIIFISTVVVQTILQSVFAYRNLDHPALALITLTAVLTAIGLPLMYAVPALRGIFQRVLIGAIVTWVTTAALLLRR